MNKNRIIKIITILLIIFITLLNFNIKVFATNPGGSTDPIDNPEYYKPQDLGDESKLSEKAEKMLGAINVAGVIVSVITLMIVGIKYMLGSIEEKAEYKKTMGMYIIGAVLVFSVTTIANILYQTASSLNK